LRTYLAGDFTVGSHRDGYPTEDFLLGEERPKALMYDTKPNYWRHISVLGAYPQEEPSEDGTAAFRHARSSSSPFWGPSYLSSAPLANVVRLQVFHASNGSDRPLCRGILLEYENGAQRALGECRYGVDPTETWSRPTSICVMEMTVPRQSGNGTRTVMHVSGASSCSHKHDDDGWACFAMVGNLEFWFDTEEASMTILVDD